MLIFSMVAAILAALVHCCIFYLESIVWTSPRTAQIFRFSSEQLNKTRELAFNQGLYNLFLSLLVFLGTTLLFFNQPVAGLTLFFAGPASMLAAALVLALGVHRPGGLWLLGRARCPSCPYSCLSSTLCSERRMPLHSNDGGRMPE